MARLPIGYSVRLAVIKKVERTHVVCEFFDRVGEKLIRCPIPQPYAGRGGGVLVGVERDTLVLVANGPTQRWYIVGIIPDVNFYTDVAGKTGIRFNESRYPELKEGEVCIKGNPGQKISLSKSGNIALDAGIGDASNDIELSKLSKAMFSRLDNIYTFTEAGRSIEGVIRRDLNAEDDVLNLATIDLLTSESYDTFLSDIGRSPNDKVRTSSSEFIKSATRNPALIEKRDIVYEYANSYGVGDIETEINATSTVSAENTDDSVSPSILRRNGRRTDVLNLNLKNYNHLIERVQGTLVDIYGNILDINRNIIPVPGTDVVSIKGSEKEGLQKIYEQLRKSVKYHFEINSRKDINNSEPPLSLLRDNNGKSHSRWSLDIDAEGLTKINIPSSSETGNVPVLSRYITSRGQDGDNTFKDSERRDIRIAQFGAKNAESPNKFAGQSLLNKNYIPKAIEELVVTAGTAHHDMLNVASLIFANGKFKNPSPTVPFNTNESVPPMVSEIDNQVGSPNANAGGRSLNMNLDGSAEISIGADTADRKSLVMDLAGGVVSHFGRDRNGRSLIHQTDGDVIIQVGGTGIGDDSRFQSTIDKENRPGRIEIHLNRPGGTPQKIIIDEDGISINIVGNGIFSATGDLVISAGGKLLLDGDIIDKFGSYDVEKRVVTAAEKRDRRKGRAS